VDFPWCNYHLTTTNIGARYLFGNAGVKSLKWLFHNQVSMKIGR